MHWLNSHGWLSLTQALLHTLWQGAFVAAALWIMLRVVPSRFAALRYALSFAALSFVVVAGTVGWAILDLPPATHSPSVPVQAVPTLGNRAPMPAMEVTRPQSRAAGTTAKASLVAAANSQHWLRYAAGFWLVGASWMMLRTLRGVIGVGQLRRRAEVVASPDILRTVEALCGRLKIARRVRLLISSEVAFPSVIGILEPAILLPAAFLIQCPTRDLRAVLAHELAHIRRWDYLTNLGQMLVEALLFFNPFVWWISRQMRIEREACCDLIAAEECESTGVYVEVLLAVASAQRVSRDTAPALAMSGPHEEGRDHLLDRSRRLLVPGYMPAPRLRWFSLCLILTVAGLGLASFWAASRAVAETIVDHERMRAITSDPQITCKIVVSTEDGGPVGAREATVYGEEVYRSGYTSGYSGSVDEGGTLSLRVFPRSESVTVAATKPGYAATFAGPMKTPVKESLDGLHLILAKGFSAQLQIVNESNQPIAGARVEGYYPGPPKVTLTEGVIANAEGVVTLDHIGTAAANVRAVANGYQADEIAGIRFDQEKPYVWKLKKAEALRGVVLSGPGGQPLVGAVIKLAGMNGPQNVVHSNPASAPQLAISDSQGRFRLTSLRADCSYTLFVEAPLHAGVLIEAVRAGQPELKVALGPDIMIRGKFTHIPETEGVKGRYHFGYGQSFKIGNGFHETGYSKEFTPKDGEAEFVIGPFYAWPVNIRLGKKEVKLEVSELPKSDLVIDLSN